MSCDQLLSITAPPTGIENWEAGFDLDGILSQVDFVNVWSMDYYGPWENQWGASVGPSAPLYSGVALRTNFNVNYTMEYYVGKTEQPEKFNIVIPFYARLWKNVTTPIVEGKEIFRNSELFDGKPEGNPYIPMWAVDHEKWTLSDAVMFPMKKLVYNTQLDEPFLPPEYRPPEVVDYEEEAHVEERFCKATTLIIVVLFVCGIFAFGLSVAILHFFGTGEDSDIGTDKTPTSSTIGIIVILILCGILALGLPAAVWRYYENLDSEPMAPPTPLEIPVRDVEMTTIVNSAPPVYEKRIIGFYDEFESRDIRKSQLSKLTHAIIACVQMTESGRLQFKNKTMEQRFLSLNKKSKNMESNQLRKKLNELEKKADQKLVLSIVAPRAGIDWESGFDLDGILEHVDFINVLSMDYYAPWPNQSGTPAGPSAPLYSGIGPRKNFNVDYTMRYYIGETKQPGKFNIVVPFYVRLWRNVKEKLKPDSEVFRNVELKDEKVEGDSYMSRSTVEHEGFKLKPASWDSETKTSYIIDHAARTFLTFEN
ncbi:hypothetical protein L5515_014478 [Caenorhabditis briggsae]|uniref:GH18 domain-containing protein n=1 Tax=Caenorhabditis briggsae TaxID=6238 RepID=A0AAE9EDC3_CAEBR|nr:hypothetical protein L5515_014478 [Caenorhabditis briggsae]